MRWTKQNPGCCRAGTPPAVAAPALSLPKGASRARALALTGAAILVSVVVLSGARTEKHFTVCSVAANYSLTLVQHDGRDYVGLLEVLEPLGKVNAKSEGGRWRLRYNGIQGDF